ncbi:MAG: hypothetical protein KF764_01730 [Labilithrix sp.]|nr:hypothetical protein [Labilithrix sp.]
MSFTYRSKIDAARGRRPVRGPRVSAGVRARARWKNDGSRSLGALVLVATFVVARTAAGEPLRLRGDALVQTRSPVGLVVLRGEDRLRPWLDVESVTWLGATGGAEPVMATGDVLTLSVRARDAASGSELRAGRMIVTMGAVRPVHVDGARGVVRVFDGTTFEAFGGVPVVRRFDYERFDWTAGGRLGQSIGDVAAVGGSYAVRRRGAELDDEEVGADFALTPAPWLTAAGRAAFDIVSGGPTDALTSISAQKDEVRGELFATHRSPGRLLPRTSLFSVLGDFAATSSGASARWRAFPRLELVATGSVQVQGAEVGGQGLGRATLALDDEWAGSVGLEARRVDFAGARWLGARVVASWPLSAAIRLATELELVRPDEARGRGAIWPWALGALAWTSPSGWEIAGALEASAGPENRESLHALARVSYALGEPPRRGVAR